MKNRRYVKLSVPLQDELVLTWLKSQENMSLSLRLLIKEHVRKHGGAIYDVTCDPVDTEIVVVEQHKPRRGRPPKSGAKVSQQILSAEFSQQEVNEPSLQVPAKGVAGDSQAQNTNVSAQSAEVSARNASEQVTSSSTQLTDVSAQNTNVSAQPKAIAAQPVDMPAQPKQSIPTQTPTVEQKSEIERVIPKGTVAPVSNFDFSASVPSDIPMDDLFVD